MNIWLAIFLGGGLGSLARFGVSQLLVSRAWNFPLGTLGANVLACLVLGLSVGIFREKLLTDAWIKAFVVIGFCGGFSTFSTFSFETLELMRNGHVYFAVANILVSVGFCLILLSWLVKS